MWDREEKREKEKRINSFEMNCKRSLSHFPQADQGSDDKLHRGTWTFVDHSETITGSMVKRRQLIWIGHVIRLKGSLANTLLHEDTDCCRKGGRPVRIWLDNNKDWNGLNFHQLIRTAENRELWSSCVPSAIKMSSHGLQAMGHR